MRRTTFAISAIVLLVGISIATLMAQSPSTGSAANAAPTFKSIAKILSANCAQCHGPGISVYSNIMQVVVPGDPKGSELYDVVSTGRMPRGGTRLAAEEVKAIRDWIAAGALNN